MIALVLADKYEFIYDGLYLSENIFETDNNEVWEKCLLYGSSIYWLEIEDREVLENYLNEYNFRPLETDSLDYLRDYYDVKKVFDASFVNKLTSKDLDNYKVVGLLNNNTIKNINRDGLLYPIINLDPLDS